jgi:hypothetical protein
MIAIGSYSLYTRHEPLSTSYTTNAIKDVKLCVRYALELSGKVILCSDRSERAESGKQNT